MHEKIWFKMALWFAAMASQDRTDFFSILVLLYTYMTKNNRPRTKIRTGSNFLRVRSTAHAVENSNPGTNLGTNRVRIENGDPLAFDISFNK